MKILLMIPFILLSLSANASSYTDKETFDLLKGEEVLEKPSVEKKKEEIESEDETTNSFEKSPSPIKTIHSAE